MLTTITNAIKNLAKGPDPAEREQAAARGLAEAVTRRGDLQLVFEQAKLSDDVDQIRAARRALEAALEDEADAKARLEGATSVRQATERAAQQAAHETAKANVAMSLERMALAGAGIEKALAELARHWKDLINARDEARAEGLSWRRISELEDSSLRAGLGYQAFRAGGVPVGSTFALPFASVPDLARTTDPAAVPPFSDQLRQAAAAAVESIRPPTIQLPTIKLEVKQ